MKEKRKKTGLSAEFEERHARTQAMLLERIAYHQERAARERAGSAKR